MCLETLKIGRLTRTSSRLQALTATANNLVCTPSPHRRLLILGPPNSGQVWFAPYEMSANGDGITQIVNTLPIVLTVEEHGDIVTQRWFAWPSVVSRILIAEGVFRDEWLREFNRSTG